MANGTTTRVPKAKEEADVAGKSKTGRESYDREKYGDPDLPMTAEEESESSSIDERQGRESEVMERRHEQEEQAFWDRYYVTGSGKDLRLKARAKRCESCGKYLLSESDGSFRVHDCPVGGR